MRELLNWRGGGNGEAGGTIKWGSGAEGIPCFYTKPSSHVPLLADSTSVVSLPNGSCSQTSVQPAGLQARIKKIRDNR